MAENKTPKEVFVYLLSDLRQGSEVTTTLLQRIASEVQDPDIKQALEARVFVHNKTVATLDECFKLIGEKPVKVAGRLYETFAENFRNELAEMKNPAVRRLFILAKISHLIHLRIGEYVALIAAADITGNFAVGVLLESCLADKLALVKRARRMIREVHQAKKAAN